MNSFTLVFLSPPLSILHTLSVKKIPIPSFTQCASLTASSILGRLSAQFLSLKWLQRFAPIQPQELY